MMKILIRSLFVFSIITFATASHAQFEDDEKLTESSIPSEDKYIDGIVKPSEELDTRVLAYEPVREADIAWQKTIYRIIDTREKMNLPFRYPVKPFFQILKELGENGDIVLFSDNAGFPDFTKPLTNDEITGKLYRVDTFTATNADTYEEEIKIEKSEIFYEDINRYRIKEIWYFDEETSMLKVRIIGIAPVRDVIDPETGIAKYPEILFWAYYPEAREYLGKYQVVNDFNDVAPMTWADLFETRFFSSFIYKKTNALDFRVQDYFNTNDAEQDGIDMLLESEKIKQELFNFEHDLWTY